VTASDSDIALDRPLCPLCRGEGFVFTGAAIARCPECDRREWEEFSRGFRDLPPCWGYASCSEECMGLCPWAKGCKEAVTG
jgi:hypothetical protein